MTDLPDDVTAPLSAALSAAGLDVSAVRALAAAALAEDLDGGFDVTSVATIPFEAEATADFVARDAGVVAGLPVVWAVLVEATDDAVEVDLKVSDGDRVAPGQTLLSATGAARALLTGERTALNLLCHLSGIATVTRQWADVLDGTGARVRDTRKTTPGLRALEKYAVRLGGGENHRMSLSDAALIKDNHVVVAGGVAAALSLVRAEFPELVVEVECDTLDQVREAVDAGAQLVLLDNMTPAQLREAVVINGGRARLEASGGLTLASAREVAETGVDYLSVGALTHSAPVLDIGVDLRMMP